ncbi:hypothetical protein BC832DRAFT_594438 [Gaertneriomyces semiglobifer]|nr:hypothetical protein BC832DRAFT_594438 [Gaertneriomyces semiglobifer]
MADTTDTRLRRPPLKRPRTNADDTVASRLRNASERARPTFVPRRQEITVDVPLPPPRPKPPTPPPVPRPEHQPVPPKRPKSVSFAPAVPPPSSATEPVSAPALSVPDPVSTDHDPGDGDPDKERRMPAVIRSMLDKVGKFDVVAFLDEVEVKGMSMIELMQWSPYLRTRVAEALKLASKPKRAAFLTRAPVLAAYCSDDIDNCPPGEDPLLHQVHRMNGLSLAKTHTHQLKSRINQSAVTSLLDGGCCLIAVNASLRRRHNWSLADSRSSIRLRMINGASPGLEGEVHNLVMTIGNHQIPFGAISIQNLDADCILGRPFLELVRGITGWNRSVYHMTFNHRWLVCIGSTGLCHDVRQLTSAELLAWEDDQSPRLPPDIRSTLPAP